MPKVQHEFSNKIRLALVVPSLQEGGGVPSVAEFIYRTAMEDGRFDVHLISLATSAYDPIGVSLLRPYSWLRGVRVEKELAWRGTSFTRVGAFLSEFEFQRYRPRGLLSQLVRQFDLVQVVAGCPAWANSVLGLGRPVSLQVATRAKVERVMRDMNARTPRALWNRFMTEVTDRFDDRALTEVDAIQVENPWMLDYARSMNLGRESLDLRYAPPGVDAVTFSPKPPSTASSSVYILCVGRMADPRKNIALLLRAFSMLLQSMPCQANLVLAGLDPPPKEFWIMVSSLHLAERVSFIHKPSQVELVELYRDATAFCLSSDEEGLGMVILEAMACGLPVVSTRSGGPDGIITNGKDGFLVDRGDAHALATRLELLLMDPLLRGRLAHEARQTIERRYAHEVAGRAFVDTWLNLHYHRI